MRIRIKMNARNICFIIIVIICIFALSYGIYYQIFTKPNKEINEISPEELIPEDIKFDELFDNKVNMQEYTSANFINKIENTKELVYTTYTLNEIYEGKYEIQVSIPIININNEKVLNIDKEILSIFYDKVGSIIENSKKEEAKKSIYTVSYTAYLNENILSLAIKATLKEGENAQRVIIKTYTYNLSTNKEVTLKDMIGIKGINSQEVENKIKETVEKSIQSSQNLSSLGYQTFNRDIKSNIYKIENSNNYLLGPEGSLYIVYAYGNTNFTTERDVIYIK